MQANMTNVTVVGPEQMQDLMKAQKSHPGKSIMFFNDTKAAVSEEMKNEESIGIRC